MDKFNPNLKKFINVSNEAGLSGVEKRKVLDVANGKEQGLNGSEEFGILEKSSKENIEAFMKLVSGNEGFDSKALVNLGNIFREYGTRGGKENALSPEDEKIVSLVIKYIEDWFYSGGIVKMASSKNTPMGSAAFVVNQLAKIKEIPVYKESIKNFDSEKMKNFVEEVTSNISHFFSIEKLDAEISKLEQTREEKKQNDLADLEIAEKTSKPLFEKMERIEKEFSENIKKAIQITEVNIDVFPNDKFEWQKKDLKIVLDKIKDQLRNYKIPCFSTVAESALRSMVWNSSDEYDVREKYDRNIYEGKSLDESIEQAKEKHNRAVNKLRESIQILIKFLKDELEKNNIDNNFKNPNLNKKKEKPVTFSGFESLRGAFESSDIDIKKFDQKTLLNALEKIIVEDYTKNRQEYYSINRQVDDTNYYRLQNSIKEEDQSYSWSTESKLNSQRRNFQKIIDEFENSKKEVLKSLKEEKGPGALYLIKSLLIAASKMSQSEFADLDSISSTPETKKPVYDFAEHTIEYSYSRNPMDAYYPSRVSFDTVHFEPLHIRFSQFAVEYQKQKYQGNIKQ